MGREDLKVISGWNGSGFVKGGCTKTRLTGVAGMYILWRTAEGTLMQFYCMDFETEGLKGYKSLANGTEKEQEDMMLEAIGVYGETFETLSETEAMDLLNLVYSISLHHHLPLPGKTGEYAHLLDRRREPSETIREALNQKLSKTMETDYEAVNYYMNRVLSNDPEAESQLLVTGSRMSLVDMSSRMVLLKNEIRHGERAANTRYYNSRALARCGTNYRLLFARLGLMDTEKGIKLATAEFLGEKYLSVKEASMIIRRPEYILVFDVADKECFDEALFGEKPCVQRETHEKGLLYTQFRRSNHHYKEQVYYMNDDIFGLYFLMGEDKLIAAAFSEEGLKDVDEFLGRPCFKNCLEKQQAFYTENPLFYQIVHQEEKKQ